MVEKYETDSTRKNTAKGTLPESPKAHASFSKSAGSVFFGRTAGRISFNSVLIQRQNKEIAYHTSPSPLLSKVSATLAQRDIRKTR